MVIVIFLLLFFYSFPPRRSSSTKEEKVKDAHSVCSSPRISENCPPYSFEVTVGARGWTHQDALIKETTFLVFTALDCGFTLMGCLEANAFALDYIFFFHQIGWLCPNVSVHCFKMKGPHGCGMSSGYYLLDILYSPHWMSTKDTLN